MFLRLAAGFFIIFGRPPAFNASNPPPILRDLIEELALQDLEDSYADADQQDKHGTGDIIYGIDIDFSPFPHKKNIHGIGK